MTVNLYYNSSDSNRLNKSLAGALSATGTLRDQCSVTDPTILIEASNLSDVNYMHIPDFGRYYYINEIVSVRNGLWAVTGHVDVLMTYRSQIRARGAVIARQQNDYNLYLDDDKFMVTAKRDFTLLTFPNRAPEGGSFVLTVAGGA